MSPYDDPGRGHRNAVQQINDARQKALDAVSKMRQFNVQSVHPNLAHASDDVSLPVLCSQAVVDYLIQLRPYRHTSKNWNIDFGTIHLPKKIDGEPSSRRIGGSKTPPQLKICRPPHVPISSATELIQAVNTTVHYSTNWSSAPDADFSDSGRFLVNTGTHGRLVFDTWKDAEKLINGNTTAEEALSAGLARLEGEETRQQEQFAPASPFDDGSDKFQLKKYKIVFPSDRLLQIVELADEIAAEMDMLAEMSNPDYDSGAGDAV